MSATNLESLGYSQADLRDAFRKAGDVHSALSTSSSPSGVHSGEAGVSAPRAGGSAFVFLLPEEAEHELFRIAMYGDRGNSADTRARIQNVLEAVQQDAYANGRRDEQEELSSVLPGVTYMDPPDGGAPTILEQLQRQAKDAKRYLWLRECDWFDSPLCVLRDPKTVLSRGPGLGADCPSRDRLDAAIDAELLASGAVPSDATTVSPASKEQSLMSEAFPELEASSRLLSAINKEQA